MKRLTLFALLLFALSLSAALPALAQADANLITLNDASPAIDVVITLPADSTGTVALEFSGAAVRLTDATNAVVFSAADARLHALELNIAPNNGSHTLTVERLPVRSRRPGVIAARTDPVRQCRTHLRLIYRIESGSLAPADAGSSRGYRQRHGCMRVGRHDDSDVARRRRNYAACRCRAHWWSIRWVGRLMA